MKKIILIAALIITSCNSLDIKCSNQYKTINTEVIEVSRHFIVIKNHDTLYHVPKKVRASIKLDKPYSIDYMEQWTRDCRLLQKDFVGVR